MIYALKQLDDLMIEEKETLRVQPCFSPIWDTGLALNALAWSGVPSHDPALARPLAGFISVNAGVPATGACSTPAWNRAAGFRISQRLLSRYGRHRHGPHGTGPHRPSLGASASRGERQIPRPRLPAVDRPALAFGHAESGRRLGGLRPDINKEWLTKIPFADHNAMLDPSCPDITARVLESLGEFGYKTDHPRWPEL